MTTIDLILQYFEVVVTQSVLEKIASICSEEFGKQYRINNTVVLLSELDYDDYAQREFGFSLRHVIGEDFFDYTIASLSQKRYRANKLSPSWNYLTKCCPNCHAHRYLHTFCFSCGILFDIKKDILQHDFSSVIELCQNQNEKFDTSKFVKEEFFLSENSELNISFLKNKSSYTVARNRLNSLKRKRTSLHTEVNRIKYRTMLHQSAVSDQIIKKRVYNQNNVEEYRYSINVYSDPSSIILNRGTIVSCVQYLIILPY
jgi:hypothetical protein